MNNADLLRYLINAVQREGHKKYAEFLSPLGITPNQSEVLQVLSKREPMSLKELGNLLICESKSPSRLVQRLVENGLIYKSKSIDDNRKSVLHLTSQGRELVPIIKEKEKLFNAYNMSSLPNTIDIKTFISILKYQIQGTESEQKIEKRRKIDSLLD
ncbi:transcriptional regulator [Leuconostoc pseudomesenteroides]|jgi:DNA-binding MarR family transcriptional regulator|uniref:MarR family winged helix-turn-helix transcriptional regulator n=1 Tax=Leuconostoc falkenbergense TaxID=2766470 RepID=UPI000E0930A2|nr:MarR family transcriptional regulator [Leuconostoc falkenbergense]MCT4410903.1 MarR family transcriptional regulator [Leuconostoc falkenbergense]RDG17630.1 transcriptional regulator [Leuconostoc pseudomesenteroides]VTU70574.1 MarR family transcriptional regulator [Lactobacillus gasseri] [Leuconostoc pseudomesenteroides]